MATSATGQQSQPTKGKVPPNTIPPNPQGTPKELANLKIWIPWRWQWNEKNKKWNKPPCLPDGSGRTSNVSYKEEENLGTFAEAFEKYKKGGVDGIGWVIPEGYLVFDKDTVYEGDELDLRAQDLLERSGSYAEKSPGGEGLHVIGRSDSLGVRHKKDCYYQDLKVEVFAPGSFVTFTGVTVEEYTSVADICGVASELLASSGEAKDTDEKVEEETRKFSSEDEPPVELSPKDMRIWRGEDPPLTAAGDVDTSEDLYRIAKMLRENRVSDPFIVESLRGRDEALGYRTYTDRPIQYQRIVDKLKAAETETKDDDYWSQGGTDLFEIAEKGLSKPSFLMEDVLIEGARHEFYGPAKKGKTMLACYLVQSVVGQGKKVLFSDQENASPRLMADRMSAFSISKENRHLLDYRPWAPMTSSKVDVDRFVSYVDESEPGLVIFDALMGHLSKCDCKEDSADHVEWWANRYVTPLQKRGITTVIIDHVGHDNRRPRGSSRKVGFVDAAWEVTTPKRFDRDKVGKITIKTNNIQREGVLPEEVSFSVGGTPLVFERIEKDENGKDQSLPDNARKALEALKALHPEIVSYAEWKSKAAEYGVKEGSFNKARNTLIEQSFVIMKPGEGYLLKPENPS